MTEVPKDKARSRAANERARSLIADSPGELSPIEQTAERALGLVVVQTTSEREERLLRLAEEFGVDDATRRAFRNHVRVYVALACSSWALNRAHARETRTAAFVAAIALAATTNENLREVMGLNEKLIAVTAAGLDRELEATAAQVLSGKLADTYVASALEPVLDRLDASSEQDEPARRVP